MSGADMFRLIVIFSVFVFILISMYYVIPLPALQENTIPPIFQENTIHYLVHSETCSIPEMDPYGPTVKRYISVHKNFKCPKWNLTTYREGQFIKINLTVVNRSTFSYCSYQPFKKRINTDNPTDWIKTKFRNFTKSVGVTDEFSIVHCFNKTGGLLTKQVYAFVLRNETFVKERKSKLINKNKEKIPMSVIMIGLESTSRLTFIRHLNWTRTFLKDQLQAVELKGYNKIGGNTFPNVAPMLLGKPVTEMNDTRHFFDKYNFIWKDFKAAGYVTQMGQDATGVAAFHYLCRGFRVKPVDYYMRHYIGTLEHTNRRSLCSGNSLLVESMLNTVKEFAATYNDLPYFSYTFYSEATHDNPNGLGWYDLPLFNLLTAMHNRSLLDNTVIIMVGDHGSRYGSIRNTYQGRMEEQLPALYVALPKWFRVKRGDLYENLKANSNKLTSNVDIYATFHDIMELGKGQPTPRISGKYGTSLLRNISTKRTCDDLKIPPAYCVCNRFVKTNSNDSVLLNTAAHWVIGEIHQILANVSDICSNLTLRGVNKAWKSEHSWNYLKNHNLRTMDFIIQLEVLPSMATFDASVRYKFDTKKFMLLGDISRTNKYHGQAGCVAKQKYRVALERYCYCKEIEH